jgi:hypothetical protein
LEVEKKQQKRSRTGESCRKSARLQEQRKRMEMLRAGKCTIKLKGQTEEDRLCKEHVRVTLIDEQQKHESKQHKWNHAARQ